MLNRLPDVVASRINRNAPGGCWLWIGAVAATGYGTVELDGRTQRAHRVTYALLKGPIPDGLTIDHLCRVKLCVNPGHLEAVTLRENILRGDGPSAKNARKTNCPRGHPYSKIRPHGRYMNRVCTECDALR